MGFNKKYITKDLIISTIKSNGSLNELFNKNVDALIMDSWSSKFRDNYNFNDQYNIDRKKLDDDTGFSSFHKARVEHENFAKLKNISNIYEHLITDVNWIDILLVGDIFNPLDHPSNIAGKFIGLRDFCVKRLDEYFITESRENQLDKLFPNKES